MQSTGKALSRQKLPIKTTNKIDRVREAQTVAVMDEYLVQNGYQKDMSDVRLHHEIYLSDPRKSDISKLKTVIRHPIKRTSS